MTGALLYLAVGGALDWFAQRGARRLGSRYTWRHSVAAWTAWPLGLLLGLLREGGR